MNPNEMLALATGAILFVVPGCALLAVFGARLGLGPGEKLCAGAGLSIAVAPLLLYGATSIGLALSPAILAGLLVLSGAVCLFDGWRELSAWRAAGRPRIDLAWPLLGAVLLLTLVSRLWMVRGIEFPLWTDSYHHTVIAQIIADTGLLPSSYAPYYAIDRFTYHFGFHTLAAWLNWLSGTPVPLAVVLAGQMVGAVAVPTSFLLASRLFNSRSAGLVSAIFVGLASQMPALFVNWGRYPQLSGQVLLAVLMVLTLDALEPRRTNWARWMVTGVAAAGLFLVHNRILVFYALFAALAFAWRIVGVRRQPALAARLLMGALVMGALATAIDWLWIRRFLEGFGGRVAQSMVAGYQPASYGAYFDFHPQELLDYGVRGDLLLLAAAGVVWGVVRRDSGVLLLLAWVAGLFAAANTHLIGITPLFSSLIVVICLYLPAGALTGYLAARIAERARLADSPRLGRWVRVVSVAGLLVISLAGARYTSGLVEPENGFVREADLAAMAWIRENTPRDALFHVNGMFWTPKLAHGLDAGYWIPYLAGRQATIPLEMYSSDGAPEYADAINRRARELLAAPTTQDLRELFRKYGVTYAYIGRRAANVGAEYYLAEPGLFRPVYSGGGVWIFQAVP